MAGRTFLLDRGVNLLFLLEVPTWVHPDLDPAYTEAAFDGTPGFGVDIDAVWRIARATAIAELRFNVRRPKHFTFAVGFDLAGDETRRLLTNMHRGHSEGRPVSLFIFRTADDVEQTAPALMVGDHSALNAFGIGVEPELECRVLARAAGFADVDLGLLDRTAGLRIATEEDRQTTLWWFQGVADGLAVRLGREPSLHEIEEEASLQARARLRFRTPGRLIATSLAELGRKTKRPAGWMAARIDADRNQGLYSIEDDGTYGIDPIVAKVMDRILRSENDPPAS